MVSFSNLNVEILGVAMKKYQMITIGGNHFYSTRMECLRDWHSTGSVTWMPADSMGGLPKIETCDRCQNESPSKCSKESRTYWWLLFRCFLPWFCDVLCLLRFVAIICSIGSEIATTPWSMSGKLMTRTPFGQQSKFPTVSWCVIDWPTQHFGPVPMPVQQLSTDTSFPLHVVFVAWTGLD